jgi:RNA polymerase sigma-70 factor, ECF subfamily
VRDEHLALDIVQDAMFKLSEKYSDRPVTEFPMLFQRILQNAIRDFFRRQKVRSAWLTPLGTLFGNDADEDYDPLETLEVDNTSKVANRPAEQLEQKQVLDFIEKAVAPCHCVNVRHSCCVTGRNWMLPKPLKPWDARRVA